MRQFLGVVSWQFTLYCSYLRIPQSIDGQKVNVDAEIYILQSCHLQSIMQYLIRSPLRKYRYSGEPEAKCFFQYLSRS